MRILWQSEPSINLAMSGSPIGDVGDVLVPPRARFVRYSESSGGIQRTATIEPPTSLDIDRMAAVMVVRFPQVSGLTTAEQVEFQLQAVPRTVAHAQIADSVIRTDLAVSGASPFAEITTQTISNAQIGKITLTNAPGSFFPGWLAFAVEINPAKASQVAEILLQAACTSEASDFVLDFGFVGFMRHWNAAQIDDSASFVVDPIDPSINQVSDGGQVFSTKTEKRRRIRFDIIPSDEDATVISTTPETAGIMTLADQIGTTQPSFWIPDEERSFAPSMNIFGLVQEWPELLYRGNNRWAMNGIVVNELQ